MSTKSGHFSILFVAQERTLPLDTERRKVSFMLHINLENVINQVKNKGFTETPIGFKKTLNNGTIPITDQICFRRITTLSEYILNLNEKGLDITNIEQISNPKIHKDFLTWEYAQNQKSSNLYKLSCIKGLGRGQIFLKNQNGEKEQKPLLTSLLKSKMVSTWEYLKYSQVTKIENPYVSRDKGAGSNPSMGYPHSDLTPTYISMESLRPRLSNFDQFETMKAVHSEKPSLLIGFDSEWVGEPREILSWQFSLVVEKYLYEYVFITNSSELLSLDIALGKILDDINYTSFEASLYSFQEACTGFNGSGQPVWKRFESKYDLINHSGIIHPLFQNEKGGWEPASYTIDKGHGKGLIDKYAKTYARDWKWSRQRNIFPYKHNVTIVCHTGKVDLTTLKSSSDYDFYLRYISDIQGGAISLNPISRTVRSRKKGYASNRYLYPLTLNFRDTMGQAPAGKKSLADLGEAVKISKLSDEAIDKERMDKVLNEEPALFFEYASRDATVTVLYASALYGYNREMAVTLTSATARAMRQSMKEYLGVESNEDFDRVYRGVQRVKKGLVKNSVAPGFLMASNKEPINERVRDIQMYSSEAYHGGLNASTEIGWIEGLTNDFDLQNAYPTAMCLVPDIDWENPIKRTFDNEKLKLSDFKVDGNYNPMLPLIARVRFSFPKKVLYPCIPVNVEGRLIYPRTSKGLDRVYACGSELYLALKLGATIEIERGWVLNALQKDGKESRSLGYAVMNLVEDRRKAKKRYGLKCIEELTLKTMVNSGYGKNAQNVVDKSTWNAYEQEMTQLGDSAITNPVSACLTTAYVRALLLATMNEAHNKGYNVYSVTTDGFIADIPTVEDLEAFELYGFEELTRESRGFLTGGTDTSIWEIKHYQHQLLNLTTRGNMSPTTSGVCAHNSTKSPYPSGSSEDREWFISKSLERDDRIAYHDTQWTTFKDLSKGSLFKVVEVERKVSMDFDLKRKPNRGTFQTVKVDFNGKSYEIANFKTLPYETVDEARMYEQKKALCSVLRTEAHWELFYAKVSANATGKKIRRDTGLEWAKLTSCVMGHRKGLWVIDKLNDGSIDDKCAWINALGLSDKRFKASDWKNARRADRQVNALPKAEIQDFLDILGAHSYTI